MYVSIKDMFWHTHENHYAVMVVNVVNTEQAEACIENAEEEASAVILNILPRQMKTRAYPHIMAPMVKDLAETVRVLVALNIDHGVDTGDIEMAICHGYSNVMADVFSYELEKNTRRVRAVVALAHGRGISMEVELGHVSVAAGADGQSEDHYTSVVQAEELMKRTECDCLAVAVNTAHDNYPESMIPKPDFERLKELKERPDMSLILHGGNGVGKESIKKVALYGINKIDVCIDFMDDTKASTLKILEEQSDIQYMEINEALEESMRRSTRHLMWMTGSGGWYTFERGNGPELDWIGLTARSG